MCVPHFLPKIPLRVTLHSIVRTTGYQNHTCMTAVYVFCYETTPTCTACDVIKPHLLCKYLHDSVRVMSPNHTYCTCMTCAVPSPFLTTSSASPPQTASSFSSNSSRSPSLRGTFPEDRSNTVSWKIGVNSVNIIYFCRRRRRQRRRVLFFAV